MRCEICGKAEATIHFKEMKNDQIRELHLCPACAEEKGFHSVVEADKSAVANQFIWMAENLYPEGSAQLGQVQCSACGLRYSEFTRTGRLGCPDCYQTFDPQLRRLLRRIHGATQHAGKRRGERPVDQSAKSRLRQLREELRIAVSSENFERAAVLRDQIRSMEGGAGERSSS